MIVAIGYQLTGCGMTNDVYDSVDGDEDWMEEEIKIYTTCKHFADER